MSDAKPREFWISADNYVHDDLASAECADPDYISDIIHVIEYSAYEVLLKDYGTVSAERDTLKSEVERLKEFEFMYKELCK